MKQRYWTKWNRIAAIRKIHEAGVITEAERDQFIACNT